MTPSSVQTSPIKDVDSAVAAAAAAFPAFAATTRSARAELLRALGAALDIDASALVQCAEEETFLDAGRLAGEVRRTSDQLRFFADLVTDGGYLEALIDHAAPDAVPPRPDLRQMLVPVGPVAVYAASNFPFAFSVLGGDTASALATGCPVVVKAHPGHPQLSRRVAELAARVVFDLDLPEGVLSLVEGFEAGRQLVQHPNIRAASFTGSITGGRALFDLAAARETPIPFFGELGSLNPVVVTSGAIEKDAARLADGLRTSFTLGVGQFCTKPGVVFAPEGADFARRVQESTAGGNGGRMLTPQMLTAHEEALASVSTIPDVEVLPLPLEKQAGQLARGAVISCTVDTLLAHSDVLLEEHFGPSTVIVEYGGEAELHRALGGLPGALTATIHASADEDVTEIVASLSGIAGRVLFEGWPTGVAVTWAQHHGGPYPATTAPFTSVGSGATRRFLRPLAYQSAPTRLLPDELRDQPQEPLPRRVDGVLQAR